MIPCTRCPASHNDEGFVLCRTCRTYMRKRATINTLRRLCKKLGLTERDAIRSGLHKERLRVLRKF